MTYTRLPINLPALFRAEGLEVVEIDGWETCGRPASTGGFDPVGVQWHHTGGEPDDLRYVLWMALTGRPDLPAPLAQIAISRTGVVYLLAAGRANHAGTAKPFGSVAGGDGNSLRIGIEFMHTGIEKWSRAQYEAGLRVTKVLLQHVTHTSVLTIAGHYETSVTGKWDPGDPDGVPFKGHRVLNMDKVRSDVKELMQVKPPAPAPIRVKIGHASMQFSDTPEQWEADAKDIFTRDFDWITGTEAGEDDNWNVLSTIARRHGYMIYRFRSNWIAIHSTLVKPSSIRVKSRVVAKAAEVAGRGHDLTRLSVTFRHTVPGVGKISVIASHYPTRGRPDAKTPAYRVNLRWTRKIGKSVGRLARRLGKGKGLAFYGGDQNIVDRHNDTFFGTPLISCWDELEKWPNTGHGNIDVIAHHTKDKRATCVGARSYNDEALFLHTDHYLIQAVYEIRR